MEWSEKITIKNRAAMRRMRARRAGPETRVAAATTMKQWREKNATHFHAYRAKYYAKNADAIKAAVKKYREDNRAEWLERHKSHNARRRGAEGHFTKADIDRLWKAQDGLCVYCRVDLTVGLDIDHILPIVRGGTNWPANLQLLCPSCNRQKHSKTDEEFRTLLTAEVI